jgi:hypothetical protein
MITLPDGCQLTRASVERALDQHEEAGLIKRWHNWHEDRPSRKRPLYTVPLAGPDQPAGRHVIDLATLHEAHAFIAGLVSAHDAMLADVRMLLADMGWDEPVGPGLGGKPDHLSRLTAAAFAR